MRIIGKAVWALITAFYFGTWQHSAIAGFFMWGLLFFVMISLERKS